MPISVPGICRNRGQSPISGFTLLELLVVLLVMGLFAGLVGAIAQPDARTHLRAEAERLAQSLELAAEESRLTGKPVAWTADAAQYRFWRWSEAAGWSEMQDDSLRARGLRPGLSISDLRIEALRTEGGLRLEFSPHAAQAYDFQMSLGAERCIVAGSPLGAVSIHASP
jgi:general secretion pathway protein H